MRSCCQLPSMLSAIRTWAESLLAILFLPALVAHELCHLAVHRLFGTESRIRWHVFALDGGVKSHVELDGDVVRWEPMLSCLSPYLLFPVALLALVLAKALYRQGGVLWELAAIAVAIHSFGFLLQAGPSSGDIRHFLARAGNDDESLPRWLERLSVLGQLLGSLVWYLVLVGFP